jgi:ethanolamine permease
MYVCMVYCIAELSAALPHAGGFYSFTRNAFGPWGGYVVGVTDTIEYVLTPVVIVVGIGDYLQKLVPAVEPYVWGIWVLAYAVFVGINLRGVELTLKVGLVVTGVAVLALVVFFAGALTTGAFQASLLFNIPPAAGHTEILPRGAAGIFKAIPFAIWFFLAIEQLPLAAEETVDVVRDMPRALLAGMVTLLALSLGVLVLNTGVGGGAAGTGDSGAPFADGLKAVFGQGVLTSIFTVLALAGLIASFHGVIYAYGRVLFSLSRAGYYPRWLSLTGTRTHTPANALIAGAVVGLASVVLTKRYAESVGPVLLNMAVFGAVLSYAAVMASYIRLRVARPDLPRPYRSPLGIPGAVVGIVLALVATAATLAEESYRPGVYGVAVFLVIALLYFALYSSKRLVAQAPEEEIALIVEAEKELK